MYVNHMVGKSHIGKSHTRQIPTQPIQVDKSQKINKRTAMFIPDSRVPKM